MIILHQYTAIKTVSKIAKAITSKVALNIPPEVTEGNVTFLPKSLGKDIEEKHSLNDPYRGYYRLQRRPGLRGEENESNLAKIKMPLTNVLDIEPIATMTEDGEICCGNGCINCVLLGNASSDTATTASSIQNQAFADLENKLLKRN